MLSRNQKALALAVMFTSVCSLSAKTHAQAYAVSYNNIVDLQITSTDENGANGPFYIPLGDFANFTVVSANSATLNGAVDPANPPNSEILGGPADAAPAFGNGSVFPGATPINNQIIPMSAGGNYSRSDGQVSTTAITQTTIGGPILPTGQATQAWNIAEAYIDADGFGAAASLNSSQTGFNTTINLQQPAIINIDFEAMPFMLVLLNIAAAGGTANANLEVTFSIANATTTVFSWSPDGSPGGIIGSTELVDEINLNGSIEVTTPGDIGTFNFVTLADLGNISPAPANRSAFSARSDVLPPGIYTLSLDMLENVDVVTGSAQPTYDLGDNPDDGGSPASGNYQTTEANGGPRHRIDGPYLGNCVDADDGTLQDATSTADDNDSGLAIGTCNGGDEDGVSLPSSVLPGQTYDVVINMPVDGSVEDCYVDGWIDFNGNGILDDAGEKIVDQLFNTASGETAIQFEVPNTVALGPLYSRFRCSRNGGLSPTGDSDNGEVEDYRIVAQPFAEVPVMGAGLLALLGMMLAGIAGANRKRALR